MSAPSRSSASQPVPVPSRLPLAAPRPASPPGGRVHAPELVELGWDGRWAHVWQAGAGLPPEAAAYRVTRVDRGLVTVDAGHGERRVPLPPTPPGSVLFEDDLVPADPLWPPAVGDWVALVGDAVVAVLPRQTSFVRRGAGEETLPQVVAANIDHVLVVTPLTDRLRPRKLERYLAVAWQSGAVPVVVLTKRDLCPDPGPNLAAAVRTAVGVAVHAVSASTGVGLDALDGYLQPARTLAMVGPSGAGKSTLANALGGDVALLTGDVRGDGKGRHTTTYRQLVRLPGGALLIDTPGLRGLAVWDVDEGVEAAFADIEELAGDCRFGDCAHGSEPGCAVTAAIGAGLLDVDRLTGYRKLRREQAWLVRRQDARAGAEARKAIRTRAKAIKRQPHR